MRSAAAAVVGVLSVGAGASGAAAQDPMSWGEFQAIERAEADARVPWGAREEAFGDWYLPDGDGPHPVVVLVHGGCWQAIADLGYVGHLGRRLADWGWAVWTPEFRRVDQDDGDWPAILEDVGAATDHLRSSPLEARLDLSTVAVVGHSSGGHLALWLAGRHRLPEDEPGGPRLRGDHPLPIHGVVGLAAIADLEDYERRGGGGCGPESVARLLGGSIEHRGERLELASPVGRLPLGVPQLLVTGALDSTVPAAHAEVWVAAAEAAGDPVRLLIPAGAGHFEVVAPWTDPFGVVAPVVRAFLDSLKVRPEAPSP
ncbi:MAG: prolyl oligopeptidase family serine peptidase [Gemmatimonadetes bacterium]|nr:prolyl oligopeptidase family serine peptidase [Gemmatimonadota bacterium]